MKRQIKIILLYFLIPILFTSIGVLMLYFVKAPFSELLDSARLLTLNQAPKFSSNIKNPNKKDYVFNSPTNKNNSSSESGEKEKLTTKEFPKYGDNFGELIIPSVDIDQPMFFGDGPEELNQGVGIFNGSHIPGGEGTTLIAGHSITALGRMINLNLGSDIQVKTNYGNYLFKVSDKQIVRYNDPKSFDLSGKTPKLLLYTCYPVNYLGFTPKRLLVTGSYVSGQIIKD